MEEKKAKMLKFIMGKGHQPSAERLKVQKELFGFSRVRKSTSFKLQNILILDNNGMLLGSVSHFRRQVWIF